MNLSKIDLNLLVIFDALFQQGQVTRAAQRVGLTQPAVSNALSRLRVLFNDPLFVRVGNIMQPTTRARELSQPIGVLLAQVTEFLGTPQFEPALSMLSLRIATTDHIEETLLLGFFRGLKAEAPALQLISRRVTELFDLPSEDLESGRIDLAIGPFPLPPPPSSGILGQRIYQDPVVCIMRPGHPAAALELTLRGFVSLEHVVVKYSEKLGPGFMDRVLEERGVKRKAALIVPHFSTAAFAVANSDLIASMPLSYARLLAKQLGLAIVKLPIEMPPLSIGLFWHTRNTADPASMWTRKVLLTAVHHAGLDATELPPTGKSDLS